MQRILLKSKLHRAIIKQADIDYEGSIEIPGDLMDAAGFWEGERVLVTSMTAGGRLVLNDENEIIKSSGCED